MIKTHYQLKNFKFNLVMLLVAITIFGIIVIGSAKQSVQGDQTIGFIISLVVMIVFSLIDYKWLAQFSWLLYLLTILMLIGVMLFGKSSGGAQRWINLGPVRFQPSELCKIFLIIFFSKFFMDAKNDLNTPKILLSSVALIAVPLVLVLKQPNLSTTIIIALIFASMIFVAGLDRRIVIALLALAIPLVVVTLIVVVQPDQQLITGYQQTRILAWLEPEQYKTEEGMQQQNSITAIGSGQLNGKGLNNDDVDSLKNGNFVPEPQTDFIFAVIGEELGFIGCCIVVILLLLIVINCILIGRRAPDTSGRLICCGMAALIGFQSLVNMGVATGLIPNTGVTLPFVSYGQTSLVSLYLGMGIVLNIGLQPVKYE